MRFFLESGFMEIFEAAKGSISGILHALTERAKELVRKEVQLAKTEISQKISEKSKDAAQFAIGGVAAYTGLLVFLMGLGYLVAWVLALAGLQPMLAAFVGLSSVGLLIILVGAGLLFKAKSALAKRNVKPVHVAGSLQETKSDHYKTSFKSAAKLVPSPSATPSASAKPKVEVAEAQAQMEQALHELKNRLSPHEMKERVKHRIESEPYSAGVFAIVAGLVSGLLVRRRHRRA
jgi:hypothetical protein